MKKVMYNLVLLPFLVMAQNIEEYAVMENGLITPDPAKITEFEAGISEHNKKYHSEGPYGARVYWITNGKNVGSYVWAMGPLPWSAMDDRPAQEGHETDWNKNVLAYTLPAGDQTYWKLNIDLSNFSKDFILDRLLVDTYDVKRYQGEKMRELMKKVHKTMVEKLPDEIFGMYTNEFPSMDDCRDLAYVNFFNKSSWLGEDGEFPQKFDEVHGAGSFATFLKEWTEITNGKRSSEIWLFRADLSGLSGEIKSVMRQ
jgi:hypothetical protein